MSSQQTTVFHDDVESWSLTTGGVRDVTFELGDTKDSDLGDFLSRPVRLASYSWAVGAPLAATFNPWSTLLENVHLMARLKNFNLLRCDMCVKFVINGNPFHYGKVIAAYQPLSGYDSILQNSSLGTNTAGHLMALSQMPSIYLDPTLSQGGELHIPFIHFKNWMSVVQEDWNVFGTIHLSSFGSLLHANGGTDNVTISVFGWAENVELTVPTTVQPALLGLTQVKEGGDTKLSTIASSVAGVATAFADVPYIGKYARAASGAISKGSSVMRMFGFSRPIVEANIVPYKPRYAGQMACTNTDELVDKLALDAKQELSVDPSCVGLDGKDELAIHSIIERESYLTTFTWTTGESEGTLLFNSIVTPTVGQVSAIPVTLERIFYHTPLSHISPLFQYWNGNLIYRFSVVASAYHKGRMRITVDPNYFNSTGGDEWNTVYTRIVDISEERDFEIDINWMQPEAFLDVDPIDGTTQYWSDAIRYVAHLPYSNGILTIEVLNELTTPDSSSQTIQILTYVRAGEDFRFMAPRQDAISTASINPPSVAFEGHEEEKEGFLFCGVTQSGEVDKPVLDEEGDSPAVVIAAPIPRSIASQLHSVFGGETVASIRSMLKRYWFYRHSVTTGTITGYIAAHEYVFPNFPVYRGHTVLGFDTGGAYNYVGQTMINYITPCYVCKKGGIRYKHYAFADGPSNEITKIHGMSVSRKPSTIAAYTAFKPILAGAPTPKEGIEAAPRGGDGTTFTPAVLQPIAEVELPFYSKYRFALARDRANKGTSVDDTDIMTHVVSAVINQDATARCTIQSFVAIAEDFNLHFYLHAPALIYYANP